MVRELMSMALPCLWQRPHKFQHLLRHVIDGEQSASQKRNMAQARSSSSQA